MNAKKCINSCTKEKYVLLPQLCNLNYKIMSRFLLEKQSLWITRENKTVFSLSKVLQTNYELE